MLLILGNYYLKNDTVEYVAYGRLTIVRIDMSITYSFEKLSNDNNYFILCETIDTIPEEVRIYE